MPTAPPRHQPRRERRPEPRLSAARRGYGRRWERYRLCFLRANPLCVECGYAAEHVDHVVAVAGPADPGFWDAANQRAVCASCHAKKTVAVDGGFGLAKKPLDTCPGSTAMFCCTDKTDPAAIAADFNAEQKGRVWQVSPAATAPDGRPNPRPCGHNPKDRRHYWMEEVVAPPPASPIVAEPEPEPAEGG